MNIIKFGGKSLSNHKGIKHVISILKQKAINNEFFYVVLSARGDTTDKLENILTLAKSGKSFQSNFNELKKEQLIPFPSADLNAEFNLLQTIFEGVKLIEDYSSKIKALVLAQGEIMATKIVALLLEKEGVNTIAVDSRDFFITEDDYENTKIKDSLSREKTKCYFSKLSFRTIPIITGFIGANKSGETTTFGRNGSNYSAALLASYLNADELQNYTHVDGIYTANPDLVKDAKILNSLSYQDANELIHLGASILHAKTIVPLVESEIPLRILNTFNAESKGTLIHKNGKSNGVKSISVQQAISVINIEGKGLLGKTGIDARIFNALEKKEINIGVISQGSSERGIGFVVQSTEAKHAIRSLKTEFKHEIKEKDISFITEIEDISIVTIVGQNLTGFSAVYSRLIKNSISILLINNTLSGKNISIIIKNSAVKKAVNIIHSEIFGIAKNINIAIFGKGNVGSTLIHQILKSTANILNRKETKLTIFAIAGSNKVLLNKNGITENWSSEYKEIDPIENKIATVMNYAKEQNLENLIAIDNTASKTFIENYIPLIENGFDLISSNKIANSIGYDYYHKLRQTLKKHKKKYLYETNVGAGLPLIDTVKLLHDSGENITRIRGVFSGSLSFLFNQYSDSEKSFASILKTAIDKGYTEPDPREDLCGNDVARKLLILARELDLENEFEQIKINNLIPEKLRKKTAEQFLNTLDELNPHFEKIKAKQKEGHVLRYVGELSGDLQQKEGILTVDLVSIPKTSSLGQLRGSDSIVEIYTDSYGDNPIIIQGAGAGASVTARGVFGDLIRVADQL